MDLFEILKDDRRISGDEEYASGNRGAGGPYGRRTERHQPRGVSSHDFGGIRQAPMGIGRPDGPGFRRMVQEMARSFGPDRDIFRGASRFRETSPSARRRRAGAAEIESRVEELGLANHVTITGPVPRNDITRYIAAIDICLQPDVTEYASPMKIFEYMGMGKCVVAPDQENIREILVNGKTALLFKPGSRNAMMEAIQQAVRDPDLRKNLGFNARQEIVSRGFLWTRNAERAIALAEQWKSVRPMSKGSLPMNILVFTSFFPNNVFPNHCVFTKERMAPFQRMNGCRMKVVAPVPYFPPVKITHRWKFSQVVMREKIEGFDVYHPRYYLTPKVGMTTYGLMMFLSALPTVKRIRKEFDFDLIDTHCVYPDGFAGVLMGRYFGKPVVVTSHGTDLNLYPKIRMIRPLLRYTLQKADRVIAVSQALKNVAVGLGIGEEKISVIPNGIDTGKFFPMPEGQARRILNLPDKKVILSVGALIPTKGFDLLIRAVKILIEKHGRKDLFLVIVGEGPARGDLEKLIASLDLGGECSSGRRCPSQEHLPLVQRRGSFLPDKPSGRVGMCSY